MGLLPRRPQDGFPTWPSSLCLVCMEQERCWINESDQIGRVQIPLHLQSTPVTVVYTQRQWFLLHLATLTGLGELGCPRGHLDHLGASTCSQTHETSHKQPRSMTLYGAAEAALPRGVRDVFQQEDVPVPQEAMRQVSMQTLEMRGETAVSIG